MSTTRIRNAPSKRWSVGGENVLVIEGSFSFEDPYEILNREMGQIVLSEQGWERIFHPCSTINIIEDLLLHVEDGSGVISEIEETLKWLQSSDIVVPEFTEVREYLVQYPDMIHVLLSTCNRVRRRFLPPDQLSLELYRDPEIEDEHMVLYVRQERYDDDIIDIIESITPEYENELIEESGWFIVTSDFASPR